MTLEKKMKEIVNTERFKMLQFYDELFDEIVKLSDCNKCTEEIRVLLDLTPKNWTTCN